ncbi:Translation machinery-associated protein 22 [Kappamyces sp. JEL0829]|nr:Translation machinery-associated protein 22 [Kappamyces sp. JEL0829]
MVDVQASMDGLSLKDKTRFVSQICYCGICSAPCEYCEFGTRKEECKAWCKEHHPDDFDKIYGGETGDEPKPETKGDSQAEPSKKKKAAPRKKVTIMIEERTKRKRITHITGLELFGVDLKKAAKAFASKFAASSAVSKKGDGSDEIIIQGDCEYELPDFLAASFAIKESDIEFLEPKKKKDKGAE